MGISFWAFPFAIIIIMWELFAGPVYEKKVLIWFFSAVSTTLSNIACMSGPDTIFSIKTGITTLVTNSIKILFFQLHPFRAEFWGYCALICSALRLMRAGWLTLVPLCPPPGNNTGRGEMRQKIICYITRPFSSSWFLLSLKQEQDSLFRSQKCILLCSEKQNLFSSSLSGAAKVRRVAVCVLMSPLLCGEQLSAGCWVLVAGGCTCLSQQNEPAPTNYSWQRTFAKLHSARRRAFSLLIVPSITFTIKNLQGVP